MNSAFSRHRGMTLVELLIALSLGIFLSTVAITLLLLAKNNYYFITLQNNQLDSARVIFSVLDEHVEKAGFVYSINNWSYQQYIDADVFAADENFLAGQVASIVEGQRGDELWVRYQGSSESIYRDCFNRRLTSNLDVVHTLRFFVDQKKRFMCQRLGYPANEVVPGVESMRLMFLSNDGDRQIHLDLILISEQEHPYIVEQQFEVRGGYLEYADHYKRMHMNKILYLKNQASLM